MTPLASNCKRILSLTINARQLLGGVRNAGCFSDKSSCPKAKTQTGPCADSKHMGPQRKSPKKEVFKSMWENPKCDPSVSKCPRVKFDDLYYRRTDKAKRKYQQTWISCPPRKIKPVVVCEHPKHKYPPLERRPHKQRPDTAKCMADPKLMSCARTKFIANPKCLKVTLPGCRGVRADVRCKMFHGPSNCKRPSNPYPSFSECCRPKIKPKRPSECACLKIRSMCEVWTIIRQKKVLT